MDKQPSQSQEDLISLEGKILKSIILTFFIYPFIITPSEIVLGCDSPHYVIEDLRSTLDFNFPTYLILQLFRVYILIITSYEVCRCLSFLILYFVTALRLVGNIYNELVVRAKKSRIRSELEIGEHIETQLAVKSLAASQELGTLGLLKIGIIVFVLSNFVTIRLYDSLPTPTYTFFPSAAVMVALIVNLLLPKTHNVIENSDEMIRNWRKSCTTENGYDAKILRRMFRSLRPTALYAGLGESRIICLNKETKVQYFEKVFSLTVDMLLTIPDSA
ncbi:hypothetical protein Fcan01_27917 [Folsomia candida]|uniref:Uncharacterized protein n=1 Tax=Folsomia candida TaxID=158441 RepID=A0A226CWG0_FOLCA|nr:hypothetical protein Fcan01_27917 [Folsomia candida]